VQVMGLAWREGQEVEDLGAALAQVFDIIRPMLPWIIVGFMFIGLGFMAIYMIRLMIEQFRGVLIG